MSLKRIVEQSDTRAGRWFDAVIYALIVVSLITFSIETVSGAVASQFVGDQLPGRTALPSA